MDNVLAHTPLGDIVAKPSGDEFYPGVYLSLKRGGKAYELVLLEVDSTDEEEPQLRALTWSPTDVWGDPLHYAAFSRGTVDKMFEEDENVI